MWKAAWISIHNDGSVTLAAAVGGHRMSRDGYSEGWQVESSAIECAIADFMAMIRTAASATHNDEYDVRVDVVWTGRQPLMILTKDNMGYVYEGVSTPLHHYTAVETTVNTFTPDLDFYWQVHGLAQDCVNQGGISNLHMIQPPTRD